MSKTLPKTLTEFSQFAAERFLQTAVFIDDKIYDRSTGSVSDPKILLKPGLARKSALRSAEPTSTTKEKSAIDEPPTIDRYSPQEIVTSFAKKRILCSLYQPKQDASVGQSSDVYQLCLASDIVIIDWDLYGDAGAKASDLVCNLIEESLKDIPWQMRLVLIYTDEKNLFDVANRIFERLQKTLKDAVVPIRNGLVLTTSNSWIAVFGKPGERTAQYQSFIIPEDQLAEHSILEFSKMASGMLQGAVLYGLSKIRENSRKILSKFNASLDPAFLTHRGLSLPDDASDHVLPLLMAEIQSVLEDQLPNPIVSEALIEDWCASVWTPRSHAKSAISSGDPRKVAREFCLKGPKAVQSVVTKKKLYTFLHESLTSKANHQLAVLMSQRTHYGEASRRLKLGTILKDEKGKFFLCLQPVCDSVRIEEPRKFLLAELDCVNGTQFNAVVEHENNWFELCYKPKVFSSVLVEFRPSGTDGFVIATEEKQDLFIFTAKGKRKYYWVAQLKAEHAQREAEEFAHQLSRVGLTESEWLRLMAKN
ncbi:MAG: response regulator receiver domain [Deltaproteobacteria bacterium]|nr:response regulator receiver domain [Deltaproteobacteria bacterium]